MAASGATAKQGEIRALSGARALPPLLLVLYHYHEAHGYQHARWFDVFVSKGYLWVEFFFALSGFVLTYAYGRQPPPRGEVGERSEPGGGQASNVRPPPDAPSLRSRASTSPQGGGESKHRSFAYFAFLKARLARLYPLHLFTLLLMLAMVIVLRWLAARGGYISIYDLPGYHPYTSFWSFIENLFLVQAWHVSPRLTWNGVSWFVSVEWFLCLIFPTYLWVARQRAWAGVASIVFGFVVLRLLIHPRFGLDITYDWGIVRGIGDFAVGVGLAVLYRALKPRADAVSVHSHSAAQVLVFAAFFYAVYATGWAHSLRDYWVLPPLFAIIFVLAFDRGAIARVFQSAPLRLLGEWSFAIYMGQTTFLQLLRFAEQRLYPHPPAQWAGAIHIIEPAVMVIVCAAWGAVLYYFVERPANAWLRQRWR